MVYGVNYYTELKSRGSSGVEHLPKFSLGPSLETLKCKLGEFGGTFLKGNPEPSPQQGKV